MRALLPSTALRRPEFEIGQAHGELQKAAAEPVNAPALAGRLILSRSGWALLEVPNGLVRGLFATLQAPGAALPYDAEGLLRAHISVMHKDEVAALGGPAKLTERGQLFHYQLGPVRTVRPASWRGVSQVWFVTVRSPELQQLRKTYGLTPLPHNGEFDFHITFAVRKTGVLGKNETSKAAELLPRVAMQNLLAAIGQRS